MGAAGVIGGGMGAAGVIGVGGRGFSRRIKLAGGQLRVRLRIGLFRLAGNIFLRFQFSEGFRIIDDPEVRRAGVRAKGLHDATDQRGKSATHAADAQWRRRRP